MVAIPAAQRCAGNGPEDESDHRSSITDLEGSRGDSRGKHSPNDGSDYRTDRSDYTDGLSSRHRSILLRGES